NPGSRKPFRFAWNRDFSNQGTPRSEENKISDFRIPAAASLRERGGAAYFSVDPVPIAIFFPVLSKFSS
ncbi:MAG: hypothetical protein ABEJ91_01860, partial [Candidatus Nanohaloarchaea archaeon]